MTDSKAVNPPSGMSGLFRSMNNALQAVLVFTASFTASAPTPQSSNAVTQTALNYSTAEAGNPFVAGWYADPDTALYDGLYWVYPTSSYSYEEQTYLDCFSSPDLIHWTKHARILTTDTVEWAEKAMWAPAPAFRNGKYYLYFAANDIQEDEPEEGIIGGIGVAVADRPEGPYADAIGKPLIGDYHNGAQPIDQDVFIDDDGQAYIYYGGHKYANVAKLNADMVSLGRFDDGSTFRNITPENYVEGSQMLKHNGVYYFMWSEGGWTGADYAVAYAMADSPLGPFPRKARILEQDSAVAKGSGHHGIIHVPGTDIYYIVYHRRPLSESAANHRVLAYDRMYFNEDGTIAPVRMLVKDNFADGEMIAWETYGAEWTVSGQRLRIEESRRSIALLDTNFADLVFDVKLSVPDNSPAGSAGVVFRVSGDDKIGFRGYYVGLSPSGILSLEKFGSDEWDTVAKVFVGGTKVGVGEEHALRVSAVGGYIQIFLDDMETPGLEAVDWSFHIGKTGVMAANLAAAFGEVAVLKPDEV